MVKDNTVIIRTTKRERADIEKAAARRHATISSYLLSLVREDNFRQDVDQALPDLEESTILRAEIKTLRAEIEALREALRNTVISATGEGFTFRQLGLVLTGEQIAGLLGLPYAQRKASYDRLALIAARFGLRDRVVRSVAPHERIKVLPEDFWTFVEKEATAKEKAEIRNAILGTEEEKNDRKRARSRRNPRPA
jgi:hypothetical protein